MEWSLPTGATQYHLQVTPHNDDGPGVNVIGDAATSFLLPPPPEWSGLLPDMTYTWRVRATDSPAAIGESDASWSGWSTPSTALQACGIIHQSKVSELLTGADWVQSLFRAIAVLRVGSTALHHASRG